SSERDYGEGEQRRYERHQRRQHEQPAVGRGRIGLFLENVLQAVGGGLQQPERTDPVGPHPVLHPGAYAPLEPGDHRDADHGHVEDHEQFDGRSDEEKGHSLRRALPPPWSLGARSTPARRRRVPRTPPPQRPSSRTPARPTPESSRLRAPPPAHPAPTSRG